MNVDFSGFWQVPAEEQSMNRDVTKRVLTSSDSCAVQCLKEVSLQRFNIVNKLSAQMKSKLYSLGEF